MKKLIALAVLAAAPLAAQTPAPVPTEIDVRELSIIFSQADADRNGKVTKTELSAYGARRGLGTLVKPQGWRDLDADRNGTLSKAEFIQGMVSARAAMRAAVKP